MTNPTPACLALAPRVAEIMGFKKFPMIRWRPTLTQCLDFLRGRGWWIELRVGTDKQTKKPFNSIALSHFDRNIFLESIYSQDLLEAAYEAVIATEGVAKEGKV